MSVNSRITVLYSICDSCNKKCSYCMREKRTNNNSRYYKLVLLKLSKLPTELEIDITGGEPTLHKNLLSIMDTLYNMDNVKRIIFTSNGNSRYNYNLLSKYLSSKDSLVIITIHLESYDPRIIDSITCLCNAVPKLEVRIAYLPKRKNLSETILSSINNLPIYKIIILPLYGPSIVYDDNDLEYINTRNNDLGVGNQPHLQSFLNKKCIQTGLNIRSDGSWNRCSNDTRYYKPIYLCSDDQILSKKEVVCPFTRCFSPIGMRNGLYKEQNI